MMSNETKTTESFRICINRYRVEEDHNRPGRWVVVDTFTLVKGKRVVYRANRRSRAKYVCFRSNQRHRKTNYAAIGGGKVAA